MTRTTVLGFALLALASGCGEEGLEESLEGDWASIEAIDQSHNELRLEAGGDGEATVYIFRTVDNEPQAAAFTFEVDWQERGEEVDFELKCLDSPFGECEEEDDISMDCVVVSEPLEMDCEADGRWRDYDFRWKKI